MKLTVREKERLSSTLSQVIYRLDLRIRSTKGSLRELKIEDLRILEEIVKKIEKDKE